MEGFQVIELQLGRDGFFVAFWLFVLLFSSFPNNCYQRVMCTLFPSGKPIYLLTSVQFIAFQLLLVFTAVHLTKLLPACRTIQDCGSKRVRQRIRELSHIPSLPSLFDSLFQCLRENIREHRQFLLCSFWGYLYLLFRINVSKSATLCP